MVLLAGIDAKPRRLPYIGQVFEILNSTEIHFLMTDISAAWLFCVVFRHQPE